MAIDEEGLYKFCDENGIPRAVLDPKRMQEFLREFLVKNLDLHRFPGGPAKAQRLPDWCHPAFAVVESGEPRKVTYGAHVEAWVARAPEVRGACMYRVETRLGVLGGAWTSRICNGVFSAAGVRDLLERLVVATVGGRHV